MPTVSVIVPIYNVERYLPHCLDALCGQTLDDIEVVCVDDGSEDASAGIVRAYSERDGRIRLVQQSNRGVSAARNAGLAAARGKYVMFADPDDYYEPDACEVMHTIISSKRADAAIAGANIVAPGIGSDEAGHGRFEPEDALVSLLSPRNAYYPKFKPALMFKESSHPFPWRMIIVRKFLEDNGLGFRDNLHYGEDEAFAFDILPRAKGVVLSDLKPFNYRAGRPRSLMDERSGEMARLVGDHLDVVDAVLSSWRDQGLATEHAADLAAWALRFVVFDIRHLPEPERTEAFMRLGSALARAFPVTGGVAGAGSLQRATRALVQAASRGDASGLGVSFYADAYLGALGVLKTIELVAKKPVSMVKRRVSA